MWSGFRTFSSLTKWPFGQKDQEGVAKCGEWKCEVAVSRLKRVIFPFEIISAHVFLNSSSNGRDIFAECRGFGSPIHYSLLS